MFLICLLCLNMLEMFFLTIKVRTNVHDTCTDNNFYIFKNFILNYITQFFNAQC